MTPEERLRMAREHPAQYEDRVVALVDVLGWSELMKRSLFDPTALSTASEAAERMSMAGGWAEEVNEIQKVMDIGLVPDARGTNFSDTFVFSFPANEFAEVHVVGMVGGLCRGLLESGHYTRVCGWYRSGYPIPGREGSPRNVTVRASLQREPSDLNTTRWRGLSPLVIRKGGPREARRCGRRGHPRRLRQAAASSRDSIGPIQ